MDVDPKRLRAWGRLLSTLLQTSEDELDDFVRERLGGAELDERSLARARVLLLHLGRALDEPSPELWRGIEHAADTLEAWERGRGDDEPRETSAPDAPSAPAPAASSHAPAPAASPHAHAPAPKVALRPSGAPGQPSPWAKSDEAAPPVAPRSPSPLVSAPRRSPSPAAQPAAHLMATASVASGASGADPLPFRQGDGAAAPAPVASRLAPNPALGATAPHSDDKGPVLPFEGAADPDVPKEPPPGMTLNKYAQLCVERKLWPDNAAGRRARFGVDEVGEAHADAYYQRRFERNSAQREVWLALCEEHQNKLTARG